MLAIACAFEVVLETGVAPFKEHLWLKDSTTARLHMFSIAILKLFLDSLDVSLNKSLVHPDVEKH